jgi:transposase
MSTSLLYHAFGIRGYVYSRTEYDNGKVIFTIHQERATYRCSSCGSSQIISRGQVNRYFLCLPIGSRGTYLSFAIPRVECLACGLERQVDVAFADPRRSYTKAFERFALELSRRMTISDVARHLNVGWDMIKDIQKRGLSRRYANWSISELTVGLGMTVFVGSNGSADPSQPEHLALCV